MVSIHFGHILYGAAGLATTLYRTTQSWMDHTASFFGLDRPTTPVFFRPRQPYSITGRRIESIDRPTPLNCSTRVAPLQTLLMVSITSQLNSHTLQNECFGTGSDDCHTWKHR
jgi:hypothetical protein